MSVHHRANYATVFVDSYLHPESRTLDLNWMDDAGGETEMFEFDIPTDNPGEPYLGIQAFDMGKYGHEIQINGDPLSKFNIPPGDGWQYWVDTVTGTSLIERTNTIRVVRDGKGNSAFAAGMVTIHWKEPVEG